MKLLILTQKVDINDDLLGFFHDWLIEFANYCEKITVVCLEKGEYELPKNIKILSMGKESGRSRVKYFFNFYRSIWSERKNYDSVFVHMNSEYVILGGIFWRLLGKKIIFWYVHKAVNLKLKIASFFADKILTASKDGCRLGSEKVKILGHGINTKKFNPVGRKGYDYGFNIIYVGRISRIKNQLLLAEAVNVLKNRGVLNGIKITIVGEAVYPRDEIYKQEILKFVKEKELNKYFKFLGSVPNIEMADIYRKADLNINLCPTGGMDKAVLESMACETPVLVLNKTFESLIKSCCGDLTLFSDDIFELADKISIVLNYEREARLKLGCYLRKIVLENCDLKNLVKKIMAEFV